MFSAVRFLTKVLNCVIRRRVPVFVIFGRGKWSHFNEVKWFIH